MKLIIILASAGGFRPFVKIVEGLEDLSNTTVIYALHRSPDAKVEVNSYLQRRTSLSVEIVGKETELKKGKLYIAEPDIDLKFSEIDSKICITPIDAGESKFHPSFNRLLKSAAPILKEDLIVITLSGALDDGVEGLLDVFEFGGVSIVQEPSEADFSSQPLNAIMRNHPDCILPADQIADRIKSYGF